MLFLLFWQWKVFLMPNELSWLQLKLCALFSCLCEEFLHFDHLEIFEIFQKSSNSINPVGKQTYLSKRKINFVSLHFKLKKINLQTLKDEFHFIHPKKIRLRPPHLKIHFSAIVINSIGNCIDWLANLNMDWQLIVFPN